MSYYAREFDTKVVEMFINGAVGLIPTDTIYGLSALALDHQAVKRIYELKGRSADKPFIVLIADIDQAQAFGVTPAQLKLARKLWPAPVSVICEVGKPAPKFLHKGTKTLAFRVPDNKELRQLLSAVGPIVSTSANRQGKKSVRGVQEAMAIFGNKLDFYVDKGELSDKSSTIVKIEAGKFKLIRQGDYQI